MKKTLYILFLVLTSTIVLSGCRDTKSSGEKVEDGIEEVGEGIEEGAEELGDDVEDAVDDN